MVSFERTAAENTAIEKIVDRFIRLTGFSKHHRETLLMDVSATHANGCRLDLRELAWASNFDLIHDVYGIHRHIDRTTGKLRHCFLPRYSRGSKGRRRVAA